MSDSNLKTKQAVNEVTLSLVKDVYALFDETCIFWLLSSVERSIESDFDSDARLDMRRDVLDVVRRLCDIKLHAGSVLSVLDILERESKGEGG